VVTANHPTPLDDAVLHELRYQPLQRVVSNGHAPKKVVERLLTVPQASNDSFLRYRGMVYDAVFSVMFLRVNFRSTLRDGDVDLREMSLGSSHRLAPYRD
jgi:hypothetical protein